jgi:McbB family protein
MNTLRIYNYEIVNFEMEPMVFSSTGFTKITESKIIKALQELDNIQSKFIEYSDLEKIPRKENGYIYLAQQNCTRTTFYFCKYFSPNLFLHMNNAHHFNLKNKYSSQFLDHIIQHQLSKMVPFP